MSNKAIDKLLQYGDTRRGVLISVAECFRSLDNLREVAHKSTVVDCCLLLYARQSTNPEHMNMLSKCFDVNEFMSDIAHVKNSEDIRVAKETKIKELT